MGSCLVEDMAHEGGTCSSTSQDSTINDDKDPRGPLVKSRPGRRKGPCRPARDPTHVDDDARALRLPALVGSPGRQRAFVCCRTVPARVVGLASLVRPSISTSCSPSPSPSLSLPVCPMASVMSHPPAYEQVTTPMSNTTQPTTTSPSAEETRTQWPSATPRKRVLSSSTGTARRLSRLLGLPSAIAKPSAKRPLSMLSWSTSSTPSSSAPSTRPSTPRPSTDTRPSSSASSALDTDDCCEDEDETGGERRERKPVPEWLMLSRPTPREIRLLDPAYVLKLTVDSLPVLSCAPSDSCLCDSS